ncbi:hypothetical protein ANCDUO_17968 [Ancylostoma duodenale]|uniref:Uncharacterized protein n=1 Tax=Ancylostoma duodenale TaxID=51022 RepID=A0A0C2CQ98_9BILA|nr:hypothetical protein ANCDUO_17968 [Ancylostoma duodenale]
MWGSDSKNALVMTDPDYPLNEVYAPFEDLAIRAFYYPIETRLEFSHVNSSLLPVELKPKVRDPLRSCFTLQQWRTAVVFTLLCTNNMALFSQNLIIPEAYSMSHSSKSPTHNRIEFVVQYVSPVHFHHCIFSSQTKMIRIPSLR